MGFNSGFKGLMFVASTDMDICCSVIQRRLRHVHVKIKMFSASQREIKDGRWR